MYPLRYPAAESTVDPRCAWYRPKAQHLRRQYSLDQLLYVALNPLLQRLPHRRLCSRQLRGTFAHGGNLPGKPLLALFFVRQEVNTNLFLVYTP